MNAEKEATIWCPKCMEAKYEVYRIPTGNAGVCTHATVPPGQTEKYCLCGTPLERKP